jgi:hypothetical protein
MAPVVRSSKTKSTRKPAPRAPVKKAAAKAGTATARTRRADATAEASAAASLAVTAGPRRAVFIDVENTSSETDLLRVLDDLKIDRGVTELTAVGNWRVIAQQLGRTLAQRGAQLVHSAPAPRVPDWSDLWIAVAAGMWLGRARAGDLIDIISDDRAFDAVGDAASRLGVAFRRITYRTHAAAAERETAAVSESHGAGRRGRRRRRRPGGPTDEQRRRALGPHAGVVASIPPPPLTGDGAADTDANGERHSASLEQIRAIIARLSARDPERGVNLDALTVALKAEGFQRPPGSPRLVTRLRRLKDVELLSSGRVRLTGGGAASASSGPEPAATAPAGAYAERDAEPVSDEAEPAPGGPKRRSRRRGGRRRSGRRRAAAPAL